MAEDYVPDECENCHTSDVPLTALKPGYALTRTGRSEDEKVYVCAVCLELPTTMPAMDPTLKNGEVIRALCAMTNLILKELRK